MSNTYNNSEIIKKLTNKPFTWGEFVQIHEIGEYVIVEYKEKVFDGVSPKVPTQYEEESSFHPYVGGEDMCESYPSLDHALAGAIAKKHDGRNTRADSYFMKGIM